MDIFQPTGRAPGPRRRPVPVDLARRALRPALQAWAGPAVDLAGQRLTVPGTRAIRLSVVLGNLRVQRVIDATVRAGDIVVDVGANIGYNTLYAARRVGPRGRVYAVEPAQDNLALLYANLFANCIANVVVLPFAAGHARGQHTFYLRGDVSAVNSLYPDSIYGAVTGSLQVPVAPLDDLIDACPRLVKIDVEGGELEVLQGMARLLADDTLRLVIEWHPLLQQAAGHAADELPRYLLDRGFGLYAVTYTGIKPVRPSDLAAWVRRLVRDRRPVDLFAVR